MKPRIASVFLVVPVLLVPRVGAAPDFVKDIKAVFEARCIKCHGPSKMEGELDLSTREAAVIGGEYGPAIVDGDPENSVLMQRIILEKGHEEVMPNKGDLLKKEEIARIEEWIKAGAAWPEDLVLKEAKRKKDDGKQGQAAESGE